MLRAAGLYASPAPISSADFLRLLLRYGRLAGDPAERAHLLANELRELVGFHRRGRDADSPELLAHFLSLHDGVDLGVQLMHHGGGRSRARPHAEPQREVVARKACFRERGNVWDDR